MDINTSNRRGGLFFVAGFILFNFLGFVHCEVLDAQVSGPCGNCHTMHNSQDGSPIDPGGPHEILLKYDCVGCHSDSSSETIRTLGGGNVPIVNNATLPSQPLAAGNFYWQVSQGDDSLGHNVKGIASGPDSNLPFVPGRHIMLDYTLAITDCVNCHDGFPQGYPFLIDRTENILYCQDCHTIPKHHADDSATIVDENGGWYRFLYGVRGIEDPDWQKTVSESDHNEYAGETVMFNGSLSDAGCGCHGDFHSLKFPVENGTASPWLRHPVDIALPDTGEYASYTTYNPMAPVARPVLDGYTGPSSTVTPGTDQVMCISCHRPHGSDQPDMLRWDYTTMIAAGGSNENGCFICHSSKDGV